MGHMPAMESRGDFVRGKMRELDACAANLGFNFRDIRVFGGLGLRALASTLCIGGFAGILSRIPF